MNNRKREPKPSFAEATLLCDPVLPDQTKCIRVLLVSRKRNFIRKHIGDFVGLEVTKGKHLRRSILRQVKDVLPTHIVNL